MKQLFSNNKVRGRWLLLSLVLFFFTNAAFSQELVQNGSMNGAVGCNVVPSGWGGIGPLIHDISSIGMIGCGPLVGSQVSWYGVPKPSPDGGTFIRLGSGVQFADGSGYVYSYLYQDFTGLQVGKEYTFSYYYACTPTTGKGEPGDPDWVNTESVPSDIRLSGFTTSQDINVGAPGPWQWAFRSITVKATAPTGRVTLAAKMVVANSQANSVVMAFDGVSFVANCVAPTGATITGVGGTFCQGVSSSALTASASGTAATSYQWYSNGNPISGAIAQNFTPSNTTAGSFSYTVTASNGCGTSPQSAGVAVTVNPLAGVPTATVTQQANCTTLTATVTVTSANATSYSVDGLAYQGSNVFTGLTPGVSHTFKAANGCGINAGSVSVTPDAKPACNVKLTAKVLLQTAWNGTAMTTTLSSKQLLPAGVSQPYQGTYNHTNTAAENAVTTAFLNAHTDITDWVLLELRSAADPSVVVASRAVFVKAGGTITDVDGVTTEVDMTTPAAGSYYVSVRHRNHLGVRSGTAIATDGNKSISFDFTSGSADVYVNAAYPTGVYVNLPEVTVTGGRKALWGGDANGNGEVRYTGSGSDQSYLLNGALGGLASSVLQNQYKSADLNLDGVIRYTGPGSDQNVLLNMILGGNAALVFTQHL